MPILRPLKGKRKHRDLLGRIVLCHLCFYLLRRRIGRGFLPSYVRHLFPFGVLLVTKPPHAKRLVVAKEVPDTPGVGKDPVGNDPHQDTALFQVAFRYSGEESSLHSSPCAIDIILIIHVRRIAEAEGESPIGDLYAVCKVGI